MPAKSGTQEPFSLAVFGAPFFVPIQLMTKIPVRIKEAIIEVMVEKISESFSEIVVAHGKKYINATIDKGRKIEGGR